jgi:myo-inositol 2-dehydrogenase/D-chiro-inositol 1-dehydrogenase
MALNVCVLGTGRMGTIHAATVAGHPGARVATIGDIDLGRAEAVAAQYGATATADPLAAVASADIDAVVIATPSDSHVLYIEAAARAGKAIFCEKPVGIEPDEVRRALETVAAAGVLLQIGFHRRFDPSFLEVKRAIDAGELGDVLQVILTSRDPEPPPAQYLSGSGGLFRDMAIHDFDMARWLLGDEPVEVTSYGSNLIDPAIGEAGDIDTAMAILRTQRGTLCHINCSRIASYGYDQRIEVLGTKGMAQAANRTPASVELSTEAGVSSSLPHYWFPERYTEAYAAEVVAWIESVSNGTPPAISGEDGLRAQLLAAAATESLLTGQPVGVPPR